MKILITGGKGQLGKHLTQALAHTSWNFKSLSHTDLDIRNASVVNKITAEYAPTIIINTAAYTAVDRAESEPDMAFSTNCDGAKNLAEVANSLNIPIIHLSTDYVFSGNKPEPYTELDTPDPVNVYGKSKLAGEVAVMSANKQHIILRTSWIFSESENNFINKVILSFQAKNVLRIVNDQFGGPTYAGDIAQSIMNLITRYEQEKYLPWGIYHYCGAPYTTWFELACAAVQKISPLEITCLIQPITTRDYPTAAKRPSNSRLDCTKITKQFGFETSNWQIALQNITASTNG